MNSIIHFLRRNGLVVLFAGGALVLPVHAGDFEPVSPVMVSVDGDLARNVIVLAKDGHCDKHEGHDHGDKRQDGEHGHKGKGDEHKDDDHGDKRQDGEHGHKGKGDERKNDEAKKD